MLTRSPISHNSLRLTPPARPQTARLVTRAIVTRAIDSGHASDSIALIKAAVAKPGSIAPSKVLTACLELEKSKALTEDYYGLLSAHPWQLVWTADSKAVKTKGKGGSGLYFPLDAAQVFTKSSEFENGVFLAGLFSLTFRGPCITNGKQLSFDVYTMFVRLGPWQFPISIKKEGKALDQIESKEVKKLPFFLYCYIDDDIVVGRGRSGGLAVWRKPTTSWLAGNGALTALKN